MSDKPITSRSRPSVQLTFDPQAAPWSAPIDRYGAVPHEALHPEFVRTVLGRSIEQNLDLPDEFAVRYRTVNPQAIEAAVLVPLVLRESGFTVLLTRRTDHLHDHAGQVSFPGGRVEHTDASPIATALRETHEETGLAPEHVDVLGSLPRYYTGTGFAVTPITGLVRPTFTLAPDEFEVAEVFEVPLGFLMDSSNYRLHRASLPDGSERQYYSIPYEKYFIWGATAAMLRGMYQVLAEAFSSSRRS
ncbi:MAG: CoA pyrophosphatase [Burkholderiaceae bacterium]|nr:CoA pyrophosphatase [Burkholderiaceae bacterium]MCD8517667.1 CoA pyrophosphatase [Burkholderiaceae bacterium]MCD8536753.1 CoA pyrophosphatase [Burkholderiaceae bacterium]MCD8564664.1 CoA pyrophosphatase [Burkholderiaceae bacterium]